MLWLDPLRRLLKPAKMHDEKQLARNATVLGWEGEGGGIPPVEMDFLGEYLMNHCYTFTIINPLLKEGECKCNFNKLEDPGPSRAAEFILVDTFTLIPSAMGNS